MSDTIPNDDVQPAISLFRSIAAGSGDALLTEGTVHADHKLLGVCADSPQAEGGKAEF